MTDQHRKTLRSFYCLDTLWASFEQIGREFNLPVDHLLFEAMRLYEDGLRRGAVPHPGQSFQMMLQKGQQWPDASMQQSPANEPSVRGGAGRRTLNAVAAQFDPSDRGQQTTRHSAIGPLSEQSLDNQPRSASAQLASSHNAHGGLLPPDPNLGFNAPPPPPRSTDMGSGVAIQQRRSPTGGYSQQGVSPRQHQQFQPVQSQGSLPIYLYFDNNRYAIGTEDFVIGRGNQRTDLTIRDGNISRRHCAILYRNGSHYIKDLGSTNGIEFQGNRIESKKIADGDIFYLCDYELKFSYQ